MKHLFVPYNLALKLKEKGFDEPCITKFETYIDKTKLYPVLGTLGLNTPYENEYHGYDQKIINDTEKHWVFTGYKNSVLDHGNSIVTAPLYQQVIDWFRDKYNLVLEASYSYSLRNYQSKIVKSNGQGWVFFEIHDNYYEALDEAIEEALKLI